MVGCMVQVFHGKLGPSFVDNTHRDNSLQVALSPGDGLLCERVAYDKYNHLPSTQQPVMIRTVAQQTEVDDYRKVLVSYIAQREIQDKAFTRWLCYFDDNKEDYYVTLKLQKTSAESQVEAEILNQEEAVNDEVAGVVEDL